MDNLLILLIFELATLDGIKGTAYKLIQNRLYNEKANIFNKVLLKYKIIRWRNKISLMAFEKQKTILELFLSSIKDVYLGSSIPKTKLEYYLQQNGIIDSLANLPLNQCIAQLKYIIAELDYPRTFIIDGFDQEASYRLNQSNEEELYKLYNQFEFILFTKLTKGALFVNLKLK